MQQRREERRQQKLRAARRVQRAQPVVGHPDPTVAPSGLNCSGCGAELYRQDPGVPGYLPSEKFLRAAAQAKGGLARTVCQRCCLLVHHRRALRLRRLESALVLYKVDLLDLPDALLPNVPALVGPKR